MLSRARGRGGEGITQQSFTGGVSAPRSNPTIFDKKGTQPFRIVYLLLRNDTPFT